MLLFSDKPYRYFPPKPNRLLIWFFQQYNRLLHLPGSEHRIRSVTLLNANVLDGLRARSQNHILFLLNHSTHSDPQIMMEIQRQIGLPSLFMAAYDLFERSRFRAWIMQKSGAFSVDREGSDSQSMKQAVASLVDGRYALTIFAEGNVYLMNDRVTPFLDGAAFLAMKAQKELGTETPLHVVPVSIKVTHLEDKRPAIRSMIDHVGQGAGTHFDPQAGPVAELKRIGVEVLKKNLLHRGYFPPQEDSEDITSLLKKAAEMIIVRLEEKIELKVRKRDELVDRVRKIRRALHKIRIESDPRVDQPLAASWADEAMLAFRILTYSGDYLDEKPTMDRFGETAEKLLEDLNSRVVPPYGPRYVSVYFSPPLNLADQLDDFNRQARRVVKDLTRVFEHSVQEGLDMLNAANPHPGGELFQHT